MTAGPVPTLSGLALNLLRNKRNVILDLKDPDGRRQALEIAATVDVVVTNLRPGTLARLGMTYEDVAAVRPDVVYCQAQGYPSRLPRRRRPGLRRRDPGRIGHPRHLPAHGRRARPRADPRGRQGERADHRLRRAGRPLRAGADGAGPTGRGAHDRRDDGVHPGRARRPGHHRPAPRPPGYGRILNPERKPQRTRDGWINVLAYTRQNYEDLFNEAGRPDLADDERIHSARSRIAHADSLYRDVARVLTAAHHRGVARVLRPGRHPGVRRAHPRGTGRRPPRGPSTRWPDATR